MAEINKMLKIFRKTEIAKRYSREVGAVWKETTTCEIEKRIGIRWNAAIQYQKDIKEALKSDFDVDIFLIDEFNYITIDTYFNEIWKACENFDFSEIKEYNIWSEIFYLFFLHSKEMAQYEKELYDDSDAYMERCKEMYKRKVIRNDYYMEKGVMPQEDPHDAYSATGSFTRFHDLYEKSERSEFLLCRKLFNIPDKHSNIVDEIHQLIANIELLCLYIALDNEKGGLKTLAKFSNFAQREEEPQKDTVPTPQVTKTKPEAKKAEPTKATKQEEEDNTSLAEKKMDKEWIQKVFTARANKYFAKAIEVGYMQETETGYLWTYSNELQPIVYFFIRIYEKGRPPYRMLRKLFSITSRLNNVATELKGADWYEDALERDKLIAQGKDPEKDATHKLKDPKEWYIELKKFFDEQ